MFSASLARYRRFCASTDTQQLPIRVITGIKKSLGLHDLVLDMLWSRGLSFLHRSGLTQVGTPELRTVSRFVVTSVSRPNRLFASAIMALAGPAPADTSSYSVPRGFACEDARTRGWNFYCDPNAEKDEEPEVENIDPQHHFRLCDPAQNLHRADLT